MRKLRVFESISVDGCFPGASGSVGAQLGEANLVDEYQCRFARAPR